MRPAKLRGALRSYDMSFAAKPGLKKGPTHAGTRSKHSLTQATVAAAVGRHTALPPLTSSPPHASLADFIQWNEQAMAALRRGDAETGRRILNSILPQLRAQLTSMESAHNATASVACADSMASQNGDMLNSWRLVYALTLNNYGCQLRRDNATPEALQQFELAKDVETAVFGKPSCSTMLNLSAVLLSAGATKDALQIATECVAAAQDREPILFITALHNLAVALGQQRGRRDRGAALPTMLRALREAQAALGEDHLTTQMLKEKCGLTAQWIQTSHATTMKKDAPVNTVVEERTSATTTPTPPPSDLGTSTSQEQARAALHTLDFGTPTLLESDGRYPPLAGNKEKASANAREAAQPPRRPPNASSSPPSAAGSLPLLTPPPFNGSATPANEEHVKKTRNCNCNAGDGECPSPTHSLVNGVSFPAHKSNSPASQQLFSSSPSPHFSAYSDTATLAEPTPRRLSVGAASSNKSGPASVHQECLDSVYLSTARSSSIPRDPLETVLQEPFSPLATHQARHHGACTLRELCGGEGRAAPLSFLRFSAPLPPSGREQGRYPHSPPSHRNSHSTLSETSHLPLRKLLTSSLNTRGAGAANRAQDAAAAPPQAQTMPCMRRVMRPGSLVSDLDSTSPLNPESDKEGFFSGEAGNASSQTPTRTTPASRSPGVLRKEENKTRQAEQPVPYPRTIFGTSQHRLEIRKARRQAEQQEEEVYREQMKAEQKARAEAAAFEAGLARVVQRSQHRAAQSIQRTWRTWWTATGQPRRHVQLQRLDMLERRRRERLAVSALPPKESAKARRATVERSASSMPPRQQHGHGAGSAVPSVLLRCAHMWLAKTACVRYLARLSAAPVDARWHEADLQRHVVRIQAVWRSAVVRHRFKIAQSTKTRDVTAEKMQEEEAGFAALVIQCAYRRCAARQARHRLYDERYGAPATTIQRWLRHMWREQTRRGVDGPTRRRRNGAAICVQRVWRGYLGRVAFRMEELRQRMRWAAGLYGSMAVEDVVRDGGGKAATKAEARQMATSVKGSATEGKAAAPPTAAAVEEDTHANQQTSSLSASPFLDAYVADCLQRSNAAQQLRDEERDRFHIPLFSEIRADKERRAWQESLRLRPTEVLRRRAELDTLWRSEQVRFTRVRAARVVQRAFRAWRKMRHDTSRDTNLLEYARLRYQQQELGRAVDRQQKARDFARAVQLYGDSASVMREEHLCADEALTAAVQHDREMTVLSSATARNTGVKATGTTTSSAALAAAAAAAAIATMVPQTNKLHATPQRRQMEAVQRRDERLIALTQPHEALHLREGPAECEARLGAIYEHPYYSPYANEEHRRTLGID